MNSYETHSGVWIAFRQPVLREKMRRDGNPVEFTWQANPGEVWEEDEFWIELSWRIDPDGSMGIRKHFESPYRPSQKVTVDEYYQFIFENVENLPETAAKEGLTALDYMKKYGAFEVKESVYERNLRPLSEKELENTEIDPKMGQFEKRPSRRRDACGQTGRRIPDAERQKRVFFQNNGRLELARIRHPDLYQKPYRGVRNGPSGRRLSARADVPAADAHPFAQRKFEMAE